MRRIHVVGGKNHGKTTLITEMVVELSRRGLRVGTIKHTHHDHELDVPGKDSYRHREAGAAVVGILTRSLNAVFWNPSSSEVTGDARYDHFSLIFQECDVVIVEGDTLTSAHKLEVWRAERNTPAMAGSLSNVMAVITDDEYSGNNLVLPRKEVPRIVDFILDYLKGSSRK